MAEILKIREITIDTMQHKDFATKEEELKLIRFYQNDLNSAKLLINVTHDKVVTDFSSATSVQIAFLKPDCKRVFQDVQNVNQMQGKYYVVLSTQTLIAYGNVIAQLRFTFPNNKVIETCKFAFTVDESIMSDEAMKSTNEFPVIQKAIEAGKKLEGVDIDGIIAAGELAKGAVKKSGDTMTGTLKAPRYETTDQTPVIFNGNTSNRSWKWDLSGDNLSVTPTNNGAPGWDASKTVVFQNLLKKTGDTMTGDLAINKAGATTKKYAFQKDGIETFNLYNYSDTHVGLRDAINNRNVWEYNSVTGSFDILSGINTNLLKKSEIYSDWILPGGTPKAVPNGVDMNTITESGVWQANGNPNLPNTNGQWFIVEVFRHTVSFVVQRATRFAGATPEIFVRASRSGTFDPWHRIAFFSEVVTNAKDGRADLVLTADGENFNGNIGPIADRKGNTVTFRAGLRRRVGSTGAVMTTLPVNMRPTLTIIQVIPATDGTPARVTIQSNGDVQLESAGNTSIMGKDVYMSITYVAN